MKAKEVNWYSTIEYTTQDFKANQFFNGRLEISQSFWFELYLWVKQNEFKDESVEFTGELPLDIKALIQQLIYNFSSFKKQPLSSKSHLTTTEYFTFTFWDTNGEKSISYIEVSDFSKLGLKREDGLLENDLQALLRLKQWMVDLLEVKNTFVEKGVQSFQLQDRIEEQVNQSRISLRDSIQDLEDVFCTLSYSERGQRFEHYFGDIQVYNDLTYKAEFDYRSRQGNYTLQFSGLLPVFLEKGYHTLYHSDRVLELTDRKLIYHGTSADDSFQFTFKNIHKPKEILQANLSVLSLILPEYSTVLDDGLETFFESLSARTIHVMLGICREKELCLKKGIRGIHIKN